MLYKGAFDGEEQLAVLLFLSVASFSRDCAVVCQWSWCTRSAHRSSRAADRIVIHVGAVIVPSEAGSGSHFGSVSLTQAQSVRRMIPRHQRRYWCVIMILGEDLWRHHVIARDGIVTCTCVCYTRWILMKFGTGVTLLGGVSKADILNFLQEVIWPRRMLRFLSQKGDLRQWLRYQRSAADSSRWSRLSLAMWGIWLMTSLYV